MSTEQAVLGGGCFWCTEAVFLELQGVTAVESGYAGGHVANPTYEQICAKMTGHAEVVRVSFDASVVSYKEVLEVFFATHDPTTMNRQGNDEGPQYRSAIFYSSPEQERVARDVLAEIQKDKVFDDPIVTEISPLDTFWPAERYHQNYYAQNSSQPYCSFVISPKVAKFRRKFAGKLKTAIR